VLGDNPDPGDTTFVGETAAAVVVGSVVNPTRVWHLFRMASRNSLCRWLLSAGSSFLGPML
jgi:hypothetical protein